MWVFCMIFDLDINKESKEGGLLAALKFFYFIHESIQGETSRTMAHFLQF